MATDGVSIKLNRPRGAWPAINELRYTVAHELMHPRSGHLWRLEDRDLEDFNRACDYVVNQMLDDYAADAAKIGQALADAPEELPLHRRARAGISRPQRRAKSTR